MSVCLAASLHLMFSRNRAVYASAMARRCAGSSNPRWSRSQKQRFRGGRRERSRSLPRGPDFGRGRSRAVDCGDLAAEILRAREEGRAAGLAEGRAEKRAEGHVQRRPHVNEHLGEEY